MRAANQPVSWWGWHWEPPVPLSIVQILQAGSMPARLAAVFWLAMERGASLIVAADPPSAGKTAVLTALLSLTPPETVGYFTRGTGETFSLPPRTDANPTYILVNEMSDHLPVYTWDAGARRAFELMAEGYSLATTMHADTVEEVLDVLRNELDVPAHHIARLTLIVPLHLGLAHGGARPARRRVAQVAFLASSGDSDPSYLDIAGWDESGDSMAVMDSAEKREAFAAWCGIPVESLVRKLDAREALFTRLMDSGRSSIPEVSAAIERFYAEEIRPRRPG